MKKLKLSIIIFLLAIAIQPGRGQAYVLSTTAPKNATYLDVDVPELTQYFVQTASVKTIVVQSNLQFIAQSDQTWCTAETIDENGVRKLKISVSDNNQTDTREAIVMLKAKDNHSVAVLVSQMGTAPNIFVDKEQIALEHYQLEFELEISGNINFAFQLPAWIKTTDTPVSGHKVYRFTADPIDETEGERNGSVVIKASGGAMADIIIPVKLTHVGYPTFAVISDTHFGNSKGEGPMVKVPKALKNITSHKKLDALFVVGDLTESGAESQYDQFVQEFKRGSNFSNPVDTLVFMLGNHDNYSTNITYQNKLKVFNDGNAYPYEQYLVIKGYPFITLSQRTGSNTDANNPQIGFDSYPKNVTDSLEVWLEKAAKDFPGKPIFVFAHVPPKFTCYSSWPGEGDGTAWPTWSMNVLNPILNKYPQVVVFGGHSHYPIGDPRSIHQGVNPNSNRRNFYTGINLGSTTYSEIHRPSVDVGNHPERYEYVTEGMILSVQANGDVKVQRYDTYRNEEITPENPWLLKAPHDGSMFEYADIRDLDDDNVLNRPIRDGGSAPAFMPSAKVTIDEYSTNSVKVTYPQAIDDDVVFRYLIQVKKTDGTVAKEYKQFSQFYLNSEMPAQLSAQIVGLAPNTSYVVAITALDSYENASTPILSDEFKTGAYTPDPGTSKPEASSLLFDIQFHENGTATDISSHQNTVLKGTVTPEVYLNEDYNTLTAKFSGSGSSYYKVDYKNNTAIKNAFSNGFTFETLYKTNTTGNVCPLSGQESGGAGIEQASGGQLQLYVNLSGSYKILKSSVTVETGKFYHVVAIYDKAKSKLFMYVDGNLAGEMDVSGSFSFPSNVNAQWVGIGGDASTGENAQFALNGEVAVARMYNKAVTRDEVFWMFHDYDLNAEPIEPSELVVPTNFPANKVEGQWQFNANGVKTIQAKNGAALNITNGGGVTFTKEDGLNSALFVNSNVGGMSPNFMEMVHNLAASQSGSTEVKDYSVVIDFKPLLNTSYLPLLWHHSNSGDADIFLKGDGSVGLSGGGLGYTSAGFVQDGWNRLVINARLSESKIDFYIVYPDGSKKESKRTVTASDRFSLRTNSHTSIFKDNNNEDGDAYIVQLVLLNAPLSDVELEDVLVPWNE